ncbi:MAG TPA: pentapeptide repeat-containing protein [Anaerolineae bacterium]|nr:pentapeptide repeat-containing protein [Anaerolineae bacterium]
MKKKTAEDIIRQYKSGYREFKGFTVEPPGNFSKTRLVGIILEGTSLMGSNFERAILERASFSAANLRGANFKGANLAKADLKGADFRGATMRSVDLSGADLRWANLEGVDFTGSIIASANFAGANLKNASLKDTDPGKWWWKAKLEDAKMDSTILPDGTVFSQPYVEESEPFIRQVIEPEPVEPAGPDYKKADRLYYEGLGDIASIQAQLQTGIPISHPKMQDLIKKASKKFAQAMEVSDADWPRFAECEKLAANLLADMKANPSTDRN